MNKIQKLIKELCPKGVEFRPIGEILKSISTGLNPRANFKLNVEGSTNYYLTTKEISSEKINFTDKTDKINDEAVSIIQKRSNLEINDILVSAIGTIGKIVIVDIPTHNFNVSESITLLKPKTDIVNPRFLMYVLRSDKIQKTFNDNARGATLKGIRKEQFKSLQIPLPPLEIQNEIVRILDTFTELERELERELESRRKQYEYYRNKLLSFEYLDRAGGGIN